MYLHLSRFCSTLEYPQNLSQATSKKQQQHHSPQYTRAADQNFTAWWVWYVHQNVSCSCLSWQTSCTEAVSALATAIGRTESPVLKPNSSTGWQGFNTTQNFGAWWSSKPCQRYRIHSEFCSTLTRALLQPFRLKCQWRVPKNKPIGPSWVVILISRADAQTLRKVPPRARPRWLVNLCTCQCRK